MTTDFQQTDSAANGSAIAAFCSGNSDNGDTESNQCLVGGSAGSTERTVTMDASGADLNAVWMEIGGSDGDIDDYDGGAGNWTIIIDISTSSHFVVLDEIHICRVNSSYVNQETLASATGLADALISTGEISNTLNQGSATTIDAGDKIIVIFAFDTGDSMARSFGYTPDSIITAPGDILAAGQPTMKRMQGVPTMPGSKDRPGRWN